MDELLSSKSYVYYDVENTAVAAHRRIHFPFPQKPPQRQFGCVIRHPVFLKTLLFPCEFYVTLQVSPLHSSVTFGYYLGSIHLPTAPYGF